MPGDIVKDFMALVAHRLDAEEAQRVELEIRQAWGGAEVYVRKAMPPDAKARAIGGSLAAGLALREAFEAAGVSRATGYRLISRR